jgi:1-acyl-sn-glycerol-3-phosphate acyltransferase
MSQGTGMKIVRPHLGTGRLSLVFDHELLLMALFPAARAAIRLRYFKLELEGLEHVPRSGRVVYAQNHAGWFPFDVFFMMYAIHEAFGRERLPFFATHESALSAPGLGRVMRRSGALPASWFRRPERLPPEVDSLGICPEGVRGNTKPFWQAYRMRDWNRGFVRAAIAREAPIVPAAVLGGEECAPVAWTVRVLEPLIGSVVGLPFALVPLPSRWKIVFHEAVTLEARGREALADADHHTAVARRVQAMVQATLDRNAGGRPLACLASFVRSVAPPRYGAAPPAAIEDPLDR